MSDEILDPKADEFEAMTIAQARAAAKLYNVPLSREMTLEDIRAALRRKTSKNNFVKAADTSSGPAPGMYRIIVHKTSDLGAKVGSRHVYVNANGHKVQIPRNIAVDVPEKVVRILENSIHYVTVEGDNGGHSYHEPQLTYPFQILASTPGPDPRPGYEKMKARTYRAREKFRDRFGYWPKNQQQLRDALKEGFIKDVDLPIAPRNEKVIED